MPSALKNCLLFVGLLIVLLIFPLLLFAYLLLYLRARVVALVLRCQQYTFVDGSDTLSGIDVESTDNLLQAFIVLDGRLDAADVRRTLAPRLISPIDGSAIYPRLKRFVQLRFGHLVWREEPGSFQISDHVIDYQGTPPTSEAELNAVVGQLINAPLARDNSGWEFVVVPLQGLSDSAHQQPSDDVIDTETKIANTTYENASTKTCLVLRFNHCIMDGVTLVRLFMECLADNSDVHRETFQRHATASTVGHVGSNRRQRLYRLVRPLVALAYAPYVQLRTLINRDRNALHDSQRHSRTRRKIFVTRILPLADVKSIKTRSNATVNDVIVSCVAGGLRRYLQTTDPTLSAVQHAMVPVHFQPPNQPLTTRNFFSVAVVELATDRHTSMERLGATKQIMEQLKASTDVAANRLVGLLIANVWPKCLVDAYFAMAPMTLCVSNLRGPDQVIKFCGLNVTRVNFVSPHFHTTGVSYGVFSYMDDISVTLTIDSGIINDVSGIDRVVDCFIEEFQDLKASFEKIEPAITDCGTKDHTSLNVSGK